MKGFDFSQSTGWPELLNFMGNVTAPCSVLWKWRPGPWFDKVMTATPVETANGPGVVFADVLNIDESLLVATRRFAELDGVKLYLVAQ